MNDKSKENIISLYTDICRQYRNVMEAFYANDSQKALEYASNDQSIREKCDALVIDGEKCEYTCVIAEKLKTINYCIHSIGREVYQ